MSQHVQQAEMLGGIGQQRAEQTARKRTHNQGERVRFNALMQTATADRRCIVGAAEGATVIVPLRRARDRATGTIVVRVIREQRLAYVQVVGSDYEPIPSHNGELMLPVFALFHSVFPRDELEERHMVRFGSELRELWEALRWACRQEIDEHRAGRVEEHVVLIEEPVREVELIPRFERSMAVSLSGKDLMLKPRFWRGRNPFFFTRQGAHKAYFRREMKGGVRQLVLIDADERHGLAPVLSAHGEVSVKIDDVISPHLQSVAIGTSAEHTEAERYIAKHLHELLPSIGLRLRPHHYHKVRR